MGLFGTAGIRGPLSRVSCELVQDIGFALGSYLGGGAVIVGQDSRITGKMLKLAISSALQSTGVDVIDVGMLPTPVLSYLAKNMDVRAGIMITASHNPPSDNGIKIFNENGVEFSKGDEDSVENIIDIKAYNLVSWDRVGKKTIYNDGIQEYKNYLKTFFHFETDIKVVVDCANGVGALVLPDILRSFGCRVITVNSQIDGFFPGRPAEPTPQNIINTCKIVKSINADIGIALDGDADRIAVIDSNGSVVLDDTLIAFFSGEALKKNRNGVVITSINTSKSVEDVVLRGGGRLIRVPLGYIPENIDKYRAVFGGEPWKMIFPEFGLWIDGIFSAVRLISAMVEYGGLENLFVDIPIYKILRKDFLLKNPEKKQQIVKTIYKNLEAAFEDVTEVLDIDGMRLNLEDGWVLVRPSGTEPKIRMVVEARNDELLDIYYQKTLSIINSAISDVYRD